MMDRRRRSCCARPLGCEGAPVPQISACSVYIEAFEPRLLLAQVPTHWSPQALLIRQDQALSNFPAINGAGETIAVIDSGIDYLHPVLGGGFGPGHKVIAGYDFVDNDPDPFPTDYNG